MLVFPARALGCALLLGSVLASSAAAQCQEFDPRFGTLGLNGQVKALLTFDDGTGPALYAGGEFNTAGSFSARGIARWDGVAWAALAAGLGDLSSAEDLAVFDDGSGPALYAGGYFTLALGGPAEHIAKWNGTSWTALGPGLNGPVLALAVWDDGSGPALYAAGAFSFAGGTALTNIARWNGLTWSSIGSLDWDVHTLAVFDSGSGSALYAGGLFTHANGLLVNHIARWNGSAWSALGPGLNAAVRALAVHDSGSGPRLYAGGTFTASGPAPMQHIGRWDGVAWTGVNGGVNGNVFALRSIDLGGGAQLYAGGMFTTAGGSPANYVAAWDVAGWHALGSGVDQEIVHALERYDSATGPAVFVGGHFTQAGSEPAQYIASWRPGGWAGVTDRRKGIDGYVYALLPASAGGQGLYAGGSFARAGGIDVEQVAWWDGTSWNALGAGVGSGSQDSVRAMAWWNSGSGEHLVVGGDFSQAGGVVAQRVAEWDGTAWSPLGSGFDQRVGCFVVHDDGSGSALYAGGYFNFAGGQPARGIARWNGAQWSAVGGSMDDRVASLIVFDDGSGPKLYAGGEFHYAGGVFALGAARWDGSAWTPMLPGSGQPNMDVETLASFDDGSGPRLYAGIFSTALPLGGLVRWTGSSWSALTLASEGLSVKALLGFDDGSGNALYVGGSFATPVGGVPANGIARWRAGAWSTLSTGVDLLGAGGGSSGLVGVNALAAFDDHADPLPDLYLGGMFNVAGGAPSNAIAEWISCPTPFQSFCPGDGTQAPCPCANTGLAGHGCDNSSSTGGAILALSGSVQPDTAVLTSSNELPSALSIFLQGSQSISAVAFGDGLRCTGGVLKRLYVKTAIGGTARAPQAGDPPITLRSAALGDPFGPGAVRYYQTYYRDPLSGFCAPPGGDNWNVSSGVRVDW